MKWIKFTIHTSIEAEDVISSLLMELGVTGVQIEDNLPLSFGELEQMFVDPSAAELMPDEVPDIDGSLVSFYLRIDDGEEEELPVISGPSATVDDSYTIHDRIWTEQDTAMLIARVRSELRAMSEYMDIGTGEITTDYTEETEWLDKWKDYYKPMVISNILVIPYWESIPAELSASVESGELRVIRLNPGSAFGSGSHDTTRLCIDMIRKYLKKGNKLIDIGAGSGILGLSALNNGAGYVYSVEIDPACEHIMRENMELNGVSDAEFEIGIGNILEDEAMRAAAGSDFDILVANILAPVTVTLTGDGQADSMVRRGGYFITSGIAAVREQEVIDAMACSDSWRIVERIQRGDWIGLVAERL